MVRADARRNREELIAQARTVFAESGADGSLDEIARRAGVASGTLYRHFPTRIELIQAVLDRDLSDLVALGRSSLTAADPFEALAYWLRAIVRHGATLRGLSAAVIKSEIAGGEEFMSQRHAELLEVGDALLTRAQRSGVVRDAQADDVLRLVSAIAWASQDDQDGAASADRMLGHVMDGLRRPS